MKYSQFNVVIKNKNELYLYNTLVNKVVDITQFRSIYEQNRLDYPDNILDDMIVNKFVIEDNFDEIDNLIKIMKAEQITESGTLLLVIAPTLKCNYKCKYCFEKNTSVSCIMSNNVQSSIITFLDKIYMQRKQQFTTLRIQWFGGEPLLCIDQVIVPLSKLLIEYCQKHSIKYLSNVITNGYLLTQTNISKLINCKISDFQISIDDIYDDYYKIKNSPIDGYDRVKHNIICLMNYIDEFNLKLRIRINVSKEVNNCFKVYDDLTNSGIIHKNIFYCLGRVRGCGNLDLSISEFEKLQKEFGNYINEKEQIILSKRIWCVQHTINAYTIDPLGNIYKCEQHVGDETKIIGDIFSGIKKNEFYNMFMNQEMPKKCRNCKILPLCLGGCPSWRLALVKSNCEFSQKLIVDQIKRLTFESKNDNIGLNRR